MYHWLFASFIVILSTKVWGQYDGHAVYQGAVISSTSGYPVPEHTHEVAIKGNNVFHSSYKAPEFGYATPKDNIFNHKQHYDDHKPNKYNEKVLRKAYNDYIDNKLALKKRIFTTLLQKTVDKTVDVTASLTKYAVDFLSKLTIDTAAHVAKTGAKAVIHKKEEKFNGNYHH